MQQPEIDLDASAGYLLKQAASALRTAMEQALEPLGLSVTQYSCLELLAQRPGLSNSELARGAFVTRQSMNVLLRAFERDGLVTRPAADRVGKVQPARLTPRGDELRRSASGAVREVELRMLAGLDGAERVQALGILRRMIDGLA